MQSVFGVKNRMFAKMFYLYLSGRKPLNGRVNF